MIRNLFTLTLIAAATTGLVSMPLVNANSHQAPAEETKTEDGMTEDGMTEDGMTEDGMTEDGMTEDGMTEDGMTEDSMDEETMTEDGMDEEATEMPDIVTIAVEAGQFNTLAAALEAADLVEVLQGEGPFTVFAPTDEAFEALPEGTLEELLLPENKEQLISILTYHVVPGAVLSADLESGEVTTVEGSDVTVEVSEEGVTVDGANVISADIEASNGVIHVIDAVILPE